MCLHQIPGLECVFQVLFDHTRSQGGQFRADGIRQGLPADHPHQAGSGAGTGCADVGEFGAVLDVRRCRQGDDRGCDIEALLPGAGTFLAVDEQYAALADACQHTGRRDRHQRVVGDHHQVRMGDDAAFVDACACGAHVGEDGRAAAFRAITRGILDFKAFREKGTPQDTAGRFHTLAATTMKANPVHQHSFSIPVRYPVWYRSRARFAGWAERSEARQAKLVIARNEVKKQSPARCALIKRLLRWPLPASCLSRHLSIPVRRARNDNLTGYP